MKMDMREVLENSNYRYCILCLGVLSVPDTCWEGHGFCLNCLSLIARNVGTFNIQALGLLNC